MRTRARLGMALIIELKRCFDRLNMTIVCHSGTSISEVIESLHETSEEISWSQSFKNLRKR
jgi:hypothetical protein